MHLATKLSGLFTTSSVTHAFTSMCTQCTLPSASMCIILWLGWSTDNYLYITQRAESNKGSNHRESQKTGLSCWPHFPEFFTNYEIKILQSVRNYSPGSQQAWHQSWAILHRWFTPPLGDALIQDHANVLLVSVAPQLKCYFLPAVFIPIVQQTVWLWHQKYPHLLKTRQHIHQLFLSTLLQLILHGLTESDQTLTMFFIRNFMTSDMRDIDCKGYQHA